MTEYMIGIDIGGTNVRVALLNEQLEIIAKENTLTSNFMEADEFLTGIREMIHKVDPHHNAKGIGIVIPAPWTAGKRTITDITNIPFIEGLDTATIEEYFEGYPVYLENDVNVIALLESDLGAAKDSNNSIYITVSTGIGSGIIIGNQIHHGANGYAGEIGSIIISNRILEGEDPMDYTLENLCSGKALESISISLYGEGGTAAELFENYRNGSDKEKDIMVQWMDDLATGLTAVIQVLDPEVIVLGGAVIVNHKWIIDGLQEKIQKKVFGSLSEKVKLVPAQSDFLSGIMGAAYYALKKIKGEYQVEK